MNNEKITEFASLVKKSADFGSLKSVTFHSPEKGERLKAKGKLITVGGKTVLQTETSLTEGRVSQENVKTDDIEKYTEKMLESFKKADLADANGNASVMISKKGAVTLLKKGKIGEGEKVTRSEENNRAKNRLLTGEEKFLRALDVSDENGRVHDKKQSKFRQICRFAEYIVDAEKKLNKDGELYVCDLCCGKSYLSFAAYHVLTEVCGREVVMDCPPLDFIARYSMLKQKLAAAATDALRLLMLESEGYKTDATELIDPEDTPKNIMLRGFRRKSFDPCSDKAREKREEYRRAYAYMYGKEPENH